MPSLLRSALAKLVRSKVLRDLAGQGIGLGDASYVLRRAMVDIEAIHTALQARGPFLFGQQITAADISLIPVLSGIQASIEETPLRQAVQQNPRLMEYIAAAKAVLYKKN